jgi:peptidoglycan L-alanyl-D-glutamate endopeptidase CwlK
MLEIIVMRNDLKLKDLYPGFAVRISRMLGFCQDKEWNVEITAGLRSFHQQDDLWQKNRNDQGEPIGSVLTNAKGGQSWHNYGLAVDIVFKDQNLNALFDDLRYAELGVVADYFHIHWLGENPKIKGDIYHFDVNFGYTINELLAIYNGPEGGLHGVWKHLDNRGGMKS